MAVWYHSNDYYFTHIGKKEINLKATSQNNIIVSIYDHSRNIENTLIEENEVDSLDYAKEKISLHIQKALSFSIELLKTIYSIKILCQSF